MATAKKTTTTKKTAAKAKPTKTMSPFMKRSMDALKSTPSWGAMIAPPTNPIERKR